MRYSALFCAAALASAAAPALAAGRYSRAFSDEPSVRRDYYDGLAARGNYDMEWPTRRELYEALHARLALPSEKPGSGPSTKPPSRKNTPFSSGAEPSSGSGMDSSFGDDGLASKALDDFTAP